MNKIKYTERIDTILGRIIYLSPNILRHTIYLNFNVPFTLTKQYVNYLRIMHYFTALCLIMQ